MSDNMVTLLRAAQLSMEGEAQRIADSVMSVPAPLHDGGGGGGFGDVFQSAVHGVNAQDQQAGERMAAVESGQSDDLVGAMVASQEASLSFSMLMQVRNKVMGAMDELIKLPL